MKKLLILFILSVLSLVGFAGEQSISSAYETRTSDVQVRNTGRVIKILPDDNKGSVCSTKIQDVLCK
ncbi:DUF3465 domain-containing protein [Alkalimarinus alittae]|uniref:DUF3465 domain-containing protein n=1 Tax=Alkalimarinus alittae TaxID=2961619 RepID=UPI003877A223